MARHIGLRAFPRRREAEDIGVTPPHISLIPIDNLIFRSSAANCNARGLKALQTYLCSLSILRPPRGFVALLAIAMELEFYEECLKTGHPVPRRLRRRYRNAFR
jgi:hypothetical protein